MGMDYNHVYDELRKALDLMRGRLASVDDALASGNGQLDDAVENFENHGYHIAGLRPCFVLGRELDLGKITARPLVIGSNGVPGRNEIRLEYKFVPVEYQPTDLLKPPGGNPDDYHEKSARHEFRTYFREHLCAGISFGEDHFLLSRDIEFDGRSFPLQVARFKQDIAVAELYLNRVADAKN